MAQESGNVMSGATAAAEVFCHAPNAGENAKSGETSGTPEVFVPEETAILAASQSETSDPLVSVIVPVYNVEPYLLTCLNSISAQSYKHLEVILVLKPGSDRSCEIAETYAMERGWTTLYVGDDDRPGDSRNRGIDIAKGKYIAFVDADDWLPPAAYQKMVELLEQTGADCALGKALRFNRSNRHGWHTPLFEKDKIFARRHVVRWLEYPSLVWNGAPWNKLYATAFLKEHAIRFPEKVFYEDIGFVMKLLLHDPRIAIETSVVYKWRVRDGKADAQSVTQQKKDFSNLSDRIMVYDWVDRQIADAGVDRRLVKAWESRKAADLLYYVPAYLSGTKYYRYQFEQIAPSYLAGVSEDACKQLAPGDRKLVQWIRNGEFWKLDTIGEASLGLRAWKGRMSKRLPPWTRRITRAVSLVLRFALLIALSPFVLLRRAVKFVDRYLKRKHVRPFISLKNGLWYYLCRKLGALNEDKFLWEGVSGRQFAGNEKYLYMRVVEKFPNAVHVWVFQDQDGVDRNKDTLAGATIVRRFSWAYIFHLATAKYLFTGTSLPAFYIKRLGTLFIQTWHGTPLKTLGFDIKSTTARDLNRNSTENVMFHQSRMWDYFVAPNQFSAEKFASAFKYSGELLKTGYPRNDLFYWDEERQRRIARQVRQRLNIPDGKKIALYAPTFRDSDGFGKKTSVVRFPLDMDTMAKALRDDWVLIIRAHILTGGVFSVAPHSDFLRRAFVDECDDPQELCLAADVLITDYSSILFDYANTRKPMVLFCPDHETYASRTRGLYFDPNEKFPGPIVTTTEQVVEAVRNSSQHAPSFSAKYQAFVEEFCAWEDGSASDRVLDRVVADAFKRKAPEAGAHGNLVVLCEGRG